MSEIRSKDTFVTSNPSFKLFKKSLKNYFNKPPSSLALKLVKNYDTIITSDEINILNILNENEVDQLKKYDSKRLEEFENKLLITNVELLKDTLIKNLTKVYGYIFNNVKNNSSSDSREYSYKNVEEIEEDFIKFSEENNFRDVQLNLFYNPDVKFIYNNKIPLTALQYHGRVQNCKLEITNLGEEIMMPTKYEVACTAINEFGAECGNIVEFCDVHIHSSIKCTDNLKISSSNKGHTIKNIEKAQILEQVKLYRYTIIDLLNEDDDIKKEYFAYSFEKLSERSLNCNCIFARFGDDKQALFILSFKEEFEKSSLEENILLKDKKNFTAVNDIFNSIKAYHKKYKNFKVSNQNKYVAKVIIFQALTNIFFDKRFHSFILGTSGSGKSIWAKILLPFFTFDYQYVIGTNITANRLLGGQDRFRNYLPGYAVTQDLVFLEESSTALNYYLDPIVQRNGNMNNLFAMLKNACGDSYNTAQQGAKDVIPRASFILAGNLEHLSLLISQYRKEVAKQYRKFSDGKDFNYRLPLFKSPEYYIQKTKTNDLSKAHIYVRKKFFNHNFFMTGLPSAEQARFAFQIVLEGEESSGITRMPLNILEDKQDFKKVHRKEFLEELSFLKNYKYNDNFKKQIENYFYEEFLNKRNNFVKDNKEDINSHIKTFLFEIIYYFIVIEKLYWNEEIKLTEEDKIKVEDFLIKNYNSLNMEESSEIKSPYFNDFSAEDMSDLFNLDLQKNEEYFLKKKEQRDQLSVETQDIGENNEEQDLGDIFGDL